MEIELNKVLANEKDVSYINPQRKPSKNHSTNKTELHPIFTEFRDGTSLLNSSPNWNTIDA